MQVNNWVLTIVRVLTMIYGYLLTMYLSQHKIVSVKTISRTPPFQGSQFLPLPECQQQAHTAQCTPTHLFSSQYTNRTIG